MLALQGHQLWTQHVAATKAAMPGKRGRRCLLAVLMEAI